MRSLWIMGLCSLAMGCESPEVASVIPGEELISNTDGSSGPDSSAPPADAGESEEETPSDTATLDTSEEPSSDGTVQEDSVSSPEDATSEDVSLGEDVIPSPEDTAPEDTTPEEEDVQTEDTTETNPTDGSTEDGIEEVPVELTCTAYCDAMEETCPHEAFHPAETCMTWCTSDLAPLPEGTPEDTAVDTIGCRMHWIEVAKNAENMGEKAKQCAKANASGGATCGSFCEVYCRQAIPVCTLVNPNIDPMKSINFGDGSLEADTAACMELCQDFSTDVLPGVSQTEQHFGYGNTVQCRLHHLQAAMIQGPEQFNAFGLHCGHGAPEPTELCLDDAQPNAINYCVFALEFCPDLFPPGTDDQACRGEVDSLVNQGLYKQGPFLSFTDTDKNSLGCLNYWIMTAPHSSDGCEKGDFNPDNWTLNGGQGVCIPPGPMMP